MTEDMLRKIRGLMAKAERTDNEAEATTFREHAIRLMGKYQIDEAELVASGHQAADHVSHRVVLFGQVIGRDWKVVLLDVLAGLHHGRVVNVRPVNRTKKGPARDGMFHLIGSDREMRLVEMVWTSLCLQLDTEATRFVKTNSGQGVHGRTLRLSFIVGWVNRVCDRLEELYGETTSSTTGTGMELVLADKAAAADEYVGKHLEIYTAPVRKSTLNAYSVEAGQVAGDRADIGQSRLPGQKGSIEILSHGEQTL